MGNAAVSAVGAQLQYPIDARPVDVRAGPAVVRARIAPRTRWRLFIPSLFEANFGEQPARVLKARERASE